MVDRFEKFSSFIFEISRYWHKISGREMKKYGFKGTHALYLTTLRHFPEGITATKLSDLCSKDKADVSRAIAFMESKGVLMRVDVNKNSYRALIKLTDAGISAADNISERAKIAVQFASRGISDIKREIFYEVLGEISANLMKLSEDGLPPQQSS